MKINPKYIQLIGDAAIPLAGYFFWDWSLYFIILFYFIDVIASEVITHLKSKKIQDYQGGYLKKKWINHGLLSGALFLLMLIAVHVALWLIEPGINFKSEVISFWTYTEMGIQQGYILVPLLAFASYQQYKMTFLMTAKFRTESIATIWKHQMIGYFLAIIAAFVLGIFGSFIQLPMLAFVLATVLGVSIFRFVKS